MSDTMVRVPGIGETKKVYVYATGGAVAAYVGYRWWQAGRTPPEEEAAPAEDSMGTIGADIGSGAGGYYGTPPIGGAADTTGGTAITTDAQWTQAALVQLEAMGVNPATASLALAKYLRGEKVTHTQADIIRRALGVVGPPPSGAKAIIEGKPSPSPSTVGQVKGVRAQASGPHGVHVSWSKTAGAHGYRLYRDGTVAPEHSGDTTQTVGGLTPGTRYTFRVTAVDSSGKEGPRSAPASATTDVPRLPAPKHLRVVRTTETTVDLAWDVLPAAEGYRLYRNGVQQNVSASRDGKAQVGGLQPNTSYAFQVAAEVGRAYTGPRSAPVKARTKKLRK